MVITRNVRDRQRLCVSDARDETGIANIIVRPDLFARDRLVVVEEKFSAGGRHSPAPGRRRVGQAEAVQAMTTPHDFDSRLSLTPILRNVTRYNLMLFSSRTSPRETLS
jgi:hypothetical protein